MDGNTQASGGKWKKILIIIGIVVGVFAAFGAGIFFLVYSLTKGPADAAEKFLMDISAGRIEVAYTDTAGVFKQYTTLEQLKAGVAQNAVLADFRDVSFPNRSINNGDAEVSGTITSKEGVTVEISVSLQKENDAWRVTSMEVGGGVSEGQEADGVEGEDAGAENGSDAQGGGASEEDSEAPAAVTSAGTLPEAPKEGQGIFVRAFSNATGGDHFDIYDATGKTKLDKYQPVNTFIDLGPGTYTLYRYGSNELPYAAQVVVESKKVTAVTLGALSLVVPVGVEEGDRFDVYDAAGKEKLENYQKSNVVISFGPGTYTLYRYGNNKVLYAEQVVVKAGQLTTATIGAIQLNGSSRYDVYDAAGKEKLEVYQLQNVPSAFGAGTYMLKKYGTALELGKVTVVAGQITVTP